MQGLEPDFFSQLCHLPFDVALGKATCPVCGLSFRICQMGLVV